MSDSSKVEVNKVVQLKPERNASSHIALARLPAPVHAVREKSRQHLQLVLRELFDKADDALFEMADKATSNHEQNLYFDSMREVRLRRRAVELSFFRLVDVAFSEMLESSSSKDLTALGDESSSLDELSLVKNDELEEMVAINGMVNKGNEQFANQLQPLAMRLDQLVPVKIYLKNNPAGADIICRAFAEAVRPVPMDVKVRLVIFKLFDQQVMATLGKMAELCNQLLIQANILPDLKVGSAARSKQPNSRVVGHKLNATDGGNYDRSESYQDSSYDQQTEEVLHTLRGLLGHRVSSDAPLQETLPTQSLVKLLSAAQQQAAQSVANVQPSALDLRALLTQLQGSVTSPAAINDVDEDVINLVGMMFEFILEDRNLAAPMKVLIGRLQIPMVKVAIADKTFFSKGGHPARRLLNEMAMAALGWQDTGQDSQRKDTFFSKMEAMVEQIIGSFEEDVHIFAEILADFRAWLEKDKRRASILEQRTIDAEDGKAKSEQARALVNKMLTQVIGHHFLPENARGLLQDAWANVMFIAALKEGTESDAWKSHVHTAEQLVWSLVVPMSVENRQKLLRLVPVLLKQLRQGLEGIAFNPFEMTRLFKQLEILHVARLRSVPVAAPVVAASVIEHKEQTGLPMNKPAAVAEIKNPTNAPVGEIQGPPYSEAEPLFGAVGVDAPTVLDELPMTVEPLLAAPLPAYSEQHMSLVNNLTQGTWFEMGDEADQKFRCRLAAIIKTTGKYIFVNRSGMKVAEETKETIAEALSSGRLQVLDDGMLFDRALEAVIGSLREQRASGRSST